MHIKFHNIQYSFEIHTQVVLVMTAGNGFNYLKSLHWTRVLVPLRKCQDFREIFDRDPL